MKEKDSDRTPKWYKNKGYPHLTNSYNLTVHNRSLEKRIKDKQFVAKYAFFPLFHVNIKSRRYKKVEKETLDGSSSSIRTHSYWKKNKKMSSSKIRPLHYANHLDAMIFGYYSELLQKNYEDSMKTYPELNNAVTAYRKIPTEENPDKNKSNIHFAKEVFDEIKSRGEENEVAVLAFDIKSFFSNLNHKKLYEAWCRNLGKDKLPKDHYNVFRATTNFSFINKDQFRIKPPRKNRRKSGFDEKRLSFIRNKYGVNAFFESAKAFREAVQFGEIRIYKNPFRSKKTGEMVGIPQGLPISATLANIYLKNFDLDILKYIEDIEGFYRRYSDDIIVICNPDQKEQVEQFVLKTIENYDVEISQEKTEKFIFKAAELDGKSRFISHKAEGKELQINKPLIYLGFEYYGYQTLIKSANLAKFYRRMIYAVRSKAIRAKRIASQYPGDKPVIFKNQLIRLYTKQDLDDKKSPRKRRFKKLEQIETGEYRVFSKLKEYRNSGNYFSYVKRAAEIMEAPEILDQINGKKARKIFHQALERKLK